MGQIEKEYVLQVANTIWQQIICTTNVLVVGSWGISRKFATQFVANVNGSDFNMAALGMNVDGYLYQGNIYVALNEGTDYYHVYVVEDGILVERSRDVSFDSLGNVLDRIIETVDNSEE